jgi:tetratricopeptide (TPR) repeat protein
MKKKISYLIILFLIYTSISHAQPKGKKTEIVNEISNQSILKYELEIDRLKNDVIAEKKRLDEKSIEFQKNLDNQKNDLVERMNLYLIFIGLVLSLVAWAINFFGKAAIKKRVEEIIENTAEAYAERKAFEILNSKITDEYTAQIIREKGEPEIKKLLSELEEKGGQTIKEIKQKGNEVINSVWANPRNQQHQKNPIAKSDEEIKEYRETLRVDEFFELAFKTKDPNIKIGLYKSVLELEPENVFALNNIGAAHNEILQYETAIEYFTKAININPKFGLALANRAYAYNQLDKLDLAMNDVENAIDAEPQLESSYAVKGNILTKLGNLIDAESALSKAIELNPNSSIAYFNRGYFNEEANLYAESEKDYIKAEELGYENKALLYNNLAVLSRRTRNFEKALVYINKAREINPDFQNIDGTLALIHADLGDEENFYKFLKIALEKGCPVWNYLSDYAFDNYRESQRLHKLIEPYKERYYA